MYRILPWQVAVLASITTSLNVSLSRGEDMPTYRLPGLELRPESITRTIEVRGIEWNLTLINAPEAWKKTRGKGTNVAILDTGIDSNHPDLKDRVSKEKNFTRSPYLGDRQGHGTHCAGVVAAMGELPGVASEARVFNAKVLGDDGSGSVKGIAEGIDWAITEGADIISMSLGGSTADAWIPKALERAESAGVIVIAAAGNEGPGENTDGYPARYPQCISVAACDANRTIADFSSRGKSVFVTAPGVRIRSTYPGGQYATLSGTSMATPHIAGLAALWVASHPEVPKTERPARFRLALQSACNFPNERTTYRGYGLPDANKLSQIQANNPDQLIIRFQDLLPAKQEELRKNGIRDFQLSLTRQTPAPNQK